MTVSRAAIAVLLIADALLVWAWLGGEPFGLGAFLVASLLLGVVGLIVGEGSGRVALAILLTLTLGITTATIFIIGTRSMRACELEEGFLESYTITRTYDPRTNTVECRLISETGEVKSTEVSVWDLMRPAH